MVVTAAPGGRKFISCESALASPASEAENPRIDFVLGRHDSGVRGASGIEERLR
jgi:hypothetical protein